jgi:NADP-dependent 3-hydroxy acid dehydrogenase YdfG
MRDKVIVITGASAGIGEAVADLVAKRGARGVVLAARREPELGAVAKRIGAAALAVPTDVTRREDNERLRDRALAKFGQIDVWINNAGRGISRLVSQLTDEDVDEMITVNLKSVLYGIQAVLPHFRERKRGHIITVSSGLSRFPFAAQRSAYSAAKAGVTLLMGHLRMELRCDYPEIHTTTIMLGVVATKFGLNAKHGGMDSRQLPIALPVGEVANVFAGVIEKPVAEIYAPAKLHELAAKYFAADDVTTLEGEAPFFPGVAS